MTISELGRRRTFIETNHSLPLFGDIKAFQEKWHDRLIFVYSGGIGVQTGIAIGVVDVSAQIHTEEPALDLEGWEDISEATIEVTRYPIAIGAWEVPDDPDHPPVGNKDLRWQLTPDEPGRYRMRVHARGRAILTDLVADEPTEDYLIQVWPAGPDDPGPGITHKWTSGV